GPLHRQTYRRKLPSVAPETRFARTRNGCVAYQVVGDGPLGLVFIPSWLSNVDAMWEEPSLARFINSLATFSRLLCFDKRGSGISDPVPLAVLPTLEEWMEDVRAVMEAARLERRAARHRGGWPDGDALRRDLSGADVGAHPG